MWTPLNDDSQLASHPDAHGLLYNRAGCFLLCPRCRVALTPKSAQDHLKNVHENILDLTGPWRKKFQELCSQLPLLVEKLPTGLKDISPFAGLQIHHPLRECLIRTENGICGRVLSGDGRSFKTHLSKAHRCSFGTAPTGPLYRTVSGQQFCYNGAYFTVIPPARVPAVLSTTPIAPLTPELQAPGWLNNLHAQIKSSLKTPRCHPGDSRVVEDWINSLGWGVHLGQYDDWNFLLSLVKTPPKRRPSRLKEAVVALFQEALDLIPRTPLLSLQKLQSPQPE